METKNVQRHINKIYQRLNWKSSIGKAGKQNINNNLSQNCFNFIISYSKKQLSKKKMTL